MRKAFLLSAVAACALFAQSAKADYNVYATVDKTDTNIVQEYLTKVKVTVVTVTIVTNPEKFAEADAIFNQRNQLNFACENCAEKAVLINGSIIGNVGITSTNQAAGNNNLQGTLISFAFDFDPGNGTSEHDGFAHAQADASQYNLSNRVDTRNIVFRDALITGSINGNIGITATNQSVGNMTNQGNIVALAYSGNPGVALADEALGQFVVGNVVSEVNVSKQTVISSSINGNIGITQTNQAAGTVLNQANVVSLAVVQ